MLDDRGETDRVGENLASSCDRLRGANGGGGLRLRLAGDDFGDGLELRKKFDADGGGGRDGAEGAPILPPPPPPPTPARRRRGDGGDGIRDEEVAIQSERPNAWTRRGGLAVEEVGCGRWTFSCLRVGLGVGGGTGGAPPALRVSRSAVAAAMILAPYGPASAAEEVLDTL